MNHRITKEQLLACKNLQHNLNTTRMKERGRLEIIRTPSFLCYKLISN